MRGNEQKVALTTNAEHVLAIAVASYMNHDTECKKNFTLNYN
jgi:hypothetical protein